jgi:pimeloyl-ACP methyl ester carboxylesterase
MKSLLKQTGIVLLIGLLVGAGVIAWYLNDTEKPTPPAQSAYAQGTQQSSTIAAFLTDSTVGLIFYPGGKVEAPAYARLMVDLQNNGINAFLVSMPFNLAVLDADKAQEVIALNPQIDTWILAGHSLGGAMAFDEFAKHETTYAGLVLLAAYPLSPTDRDVLIIGATNDQVLDRDKLEGFEVEWIDGGNHAQFGDYGDQSGDGVATISEAQQRQQVLTLILSYIDQLP